MSGTLKTGREWSDADVDQTVLDPDGWDRRDRGAEGVYFAITLITEEEYLRRSAGSTCDLGPTLLWKPFWLETNAYHGQIDKPSDWQKALIAQSKHNRNLEHLQERLFTYPNAGGSIPYFTFTCYESSVSLGQWADDNDVSLDVPVPQEV